MNFNSSRLKTRIGALFLSFALLATMVLPTYAVDTVDELEQATSGLESELSELNNELDVLSVELSEIISQISKTSSELEHTKESLSIAKGEEQAQYESMKLRIKYMYENGNTSILEMLFSSTCMAEFLNRAEFYSSIAEYDRALLKQLTETRESIAKQEMELEEKQAQLSSLQTELAEKETALNSKISSTSAELSKYSAQLEQAREEVRKAEEALKQEVIPVPPAPPEDSSDIPSEDVPDFSDRPSTDTPDSSDTSSEDVPDSSDTSPEDVPDSSDTPSEDIPVSSTASDVELLAALIECEAGSTDYEGMLAVGSVVVNRMKHRYYPDTLHGVIFQSGQFPPALNGKVDRIIARGVKDSCVVAARDALSGKNNVGDCLSFRASSSGHAGTIIGDNVFF